MPRSSEAVREYHRPCEQHTFDVQHPTPDMGSIWFTPQRVLFLFCSVNMLVYLDRGVCCNSGSLVHPTTHPSPPGLMGSNGVNGRYTGDVSQDHGIQGDFRLSNVQDGVLASAFMVGLLVASPIFAEATKRYNALRLMGVGLAIWTAATLGCALSIGFWSILLFRMLVGVGEASFVSLAAPFIGMPPGRDCPVQSPPCTCDTLHLLIEKHHVPCPCTMSMCHAARVNLAHWSQMTRPLAPARPCGWRRFTCASPLALHWAMCWEAWCTARWGGMATGAWRFCL